MRQREFSLGGIERFLYESAKSGQIPREDFPGSGHDLGQSVSLIPTSAVQSAARSYCDDFEGRALDTRLGYWLNELGITKSQRYVGGGARQYKYVFPPLEEYRERVSKRLNLPIVPCPEPEKVASL